MINWDFNSDEWNYDENEGRYEIIHIVNELIPSFNTGALNNINIKKDIVNEETENIDGKTYSEIINKFDDAIQSIEEDTASADITNIKNNHELFDSNDRNIDDKEWKEIINRLDSILQDGCSPETVKIIKELIEAIRKRAFKQVILGRFYAGKNINDSHIIIYMKTIRESANEMGINMNILMYEVMAHELFHAVHYFNSSDYIKKTWSVSNNNIKKNVVKESLADCFAALALKGARGWEEKEIRGALNSLKEKWTTHYYLNYPYAGAQYLLACDDYERLLMRYREEGVFFRGVANMACQKWNSAYACIAVAEKNGDKAGLCKCLNMEEANDVSMNLFLEKFDYNGKELYEFGKHFRHITGKQIDTNKLPDWSKEEYIQFIDLLSEEYRINKVGKLSCEQRGFEDREKIM